MKTRKLVLHVLLSVALLIMALNLSCRIAAGWGHTVGLKADGTVVAVGDNSHGQCNVDGWTDIAQVAAGDAHTVGLKVDGTVVATGRNVFGECDVDGWTDIRLVAAGGSHTVGLKSDGSVVALGYNGNGQCDVDGWTDIIQISAGYLHTVGCKADGSVVAVGDNSRGQCNVDGWTYITQVAAGGEHTVGLKADGTVVAVGNNEYGQCNVDGWTYITQVAAGYFHTVGLCAGGDVVAVGCNDFGQCLVGRWDVWNIVEVAAGWHHTVGLKEDGSVVAMGANSYGQCDVLGWCLGVQGYYLTISSTAGGNVTTPGEGPFPYDREKMVNLVATPDVGYHFVNWTGDVDTIANVQDASTTITMEGNYQITANFWEGDPCFIATAVYGTPMAEEIEILREFRDEYLLTNPMGQALVALYYSVSPPIADFINEHPSLKPIVRAGLLPAVAMSAVAVNTSPAEKIAIVGLLVLVSVALALWAARRRGRGPRYTRG